MEVIGCDNTEEKFIQCIETLSLKGKKKKVSWVNQKMDILRPVRIHTQHTTQHGKQET